MSENKYNHVFPEPKGDIVKLLYLIYFYFYFNDYAPENIHISGAVPNFLYFFFKKCFFKNDKIGNLLPEYWQKNNQPNYFSSETLKKKNTGYGESFHP